MNSAAKKHRSLSRLLTTLVVMVSGGIATIIIALEMLFLYQDEAGALMKSMRSSAVTAAPLMTEALWKSDTESMRKISEGIASNEGVLSVTVKDFDGKEKYSVSFSPTAEVQSSAVVTSPLAYATGPQQLQKIGTMEVLYAQNAAIDKVRGVLMRTIGLNVLKTILVATMLLLIFNRIIISPIRKIVAYFRENKANEPRPDIMSGDSKLVKTGSGPHNEIDEMIVSILSRETLLADYIAKSKKTMADQSQSIRIGKKTIEAQSAQLREADEKIKEERARAEAATRLAQLGEMAAGIAHEINNPLTILMGYQMVIKMQMNKDSMDKEKVSSMIQKTEAMVMRITKIIQGLRNFARDGDHDAFEPADVNKLLENVAMLAEFRMRQSDIELRVVKPESELTLDCRAIQLEQVLVNTLNNAHDAIAGKAGDKWVELRAFQVGDHCVFWVTDCGNGIPADVVDKIFNPFFTTKEVGKGTGIGLSISFGIIREHNGSIRVDRECPNTRFVIEIPLKRVRDESASEGGKSVA